MLIFMEEKQVKEKINSLYKNNSIIEFHWDPEKIKWIEIV
ncbi:hypothetical protein QFZ72_005774 [Bacillus sp. V2I10]|nr:hypothetical protein [Bacillus sp. V2I10]